MKKALFACVLGLVVADGYAGQPKIVGGAQSDGPYPWMVSLHYAGEADAYQSQFCGGSLIDSQWVLTAAHCFFDTEGNQSVQGGDIEVAVGQFDLTQITSAELVGVAEVIPHADYNPDTFDNDVAVLRLSSPVTSDPVALLPKSDVDALIEGEKLLVMGWGTRQFEENDFPEKLHEVELPFQTIQTCSDAYDTVFDKRVICTGSPDGGIDSCQGDSGGPLLYSVDGEYQQVATVSWGDGCGMAGSYGLNQRVVTYRQWLVNKTGKDFYAVGGEPPIEPEEDDDGGGGGSVGWLLVLAGIAFAGSRARRRGK